MPCRPPIQAILRTPEGDSLAAVFRSAECFRFQDTSGLRLGPVAHPMSPLFASAALGGRDLRRMIPHICGWPHVNVEMLISYSWGAATGRPLSLLLEATTVVISILGLWFEMSLIPKEPECLAERRPGIDVLRPCWPS